MNQALAISSPAAGPLLDVRGLTKLYPAVTALDGVDFALHAGEVRGLLGENGAGKSTLIKCITGAERPTSGSIRMCGRELDLHGIAAAQAAGIAAVYQEVELLPNLTVAENLFLGRQPTRFGLVRSREMNRRAAELLCDFGLDIDVSRPLGDYSIAVQHLTAIARARDLSAQVLILDEPTASLDAQEVTMLFAILRRLRDRGLGIVFVTHFLEQVYAICDRVTVLRNGRLVGERALQGLPRLELIAMMLGRELLSETEVRKEPALGTAARPQPLARFQGIGKRRYVKPFDLDIRPGEAVGMAGLLGSGRTESARLLFGAERHDTGTVEVEGRTVDLRSPRHAIALGFGYCPEERKTDGLVGDLSVRENIILALQARRGWLRPIGRAEQCRVASRFIELLDIRTPDAERPVRFLSGGNQQKALLARWLATEPRFLILDEPTRGIDVGAHAEIVRLIRALCADGLALLVISSELEEIAAYSDRVVVLRDRGHVGTLEGDAICASAIMALIATPSTPEVAAGTAARGAGQPSGREERFAEAAQ